ncbi:hypothetical protein [Sulfuricystis multivorans]|uniref:hypothetical protein n=1 Tax=Sulfuricystis multivorans TaxID=2211108 RepID=UPI000F83B210|nr:hypothetical protein [Sulfuricystis multivorans]
MKKLVKNFPEYDFVIYHELGYDEYAVMLEKNGAYSVCRMQPKRLIAMSPNYQANGYGLLSGPLTRAGLADLLQWTDRDTASERYRLLAGLPDNVVAFTPDKRSPG